MKPGLWRSCRRHVLSRYVRPATLLSMPRRLPLLLANIVAGSAIREAAEPIVTFIGGAAAVCSAALCVHEWSKDEPRWEQAMGHGAVAGALIGAGLLILDAAS